MTQFTRSEQSNQHSDMVRFWQTRTCLWAERWALVLSGLHMLTNTCLASAVAILDAT